MTCIRTALVRLAAIVVIGLLSSELEAFAQDLPWAVYYADSATPGTFDDYDLLILDSDFEDPLEPLADSGKTLLGYLSIGEANQQRTYFDELAAEGILLQENQNWRGSYFIDVRDPRWRNRVIEDLIPILLDRGFDGVFLDTADNAAHLERVDPETFRGMTFAMGRMVAEIRRHFPSIQIALNRGFELLGQVAGHIDLVLGESMLTDYDFQDRSYKLVPDTLYEEQVDWLRAAKRRQPGLVVLTLDYWDPADMEGIANIYELQRRNGFNPYVATIELNRIVKEPNR